MVKEIYGKKIGMTEVFSEEGDLVPTTLIEIEPAYVLEKVESASKTKVRLGCFKLGEKMLTKVRKPQKGYFDKLKISPYKLIREVDIAKGANFSFENKEANQESKSELKDPREVGVEIFTEGSLVDIRALTKGKGFAGGMKRYGWGGQPKSHGHTTHRRPGSIQSGPRLTRITKGKHMPGHLGNCFRTVKNLKILKVDKEKNLLFLKGSVPGFRGTIVQIKKVG